MSREQQICAAIFIAVAFGTGGFLTGYDLGVEQGKKIGQPMKLSIELRPAHNLIECSKQGFEEFYRTCRARSRMEKVTNGR